MFCMFYMFYRIIHNLIYNVKRKQPGGCKYAGTMCSHKIKTRMPSSVKMLRRLLARVSANSLRSDRALTRATMLAFSTDPAYGFVFMRNTWPRLCLFKPADLCWKKFRIKRSHRILHAK